MDTGGEKKYGTAKYRREIIEKPGVLKSIPRYFKRYGISLDEFRERFRSLLPCDFIFVTSLMTYWYPGIQKAIEIMKSISPHTPVILGGIYATLCYDHAGKNSGADFVYRGHINENITSVLGNFGIPLSDNTSPPPPGKSKNNFTPRNGRSDVRYYQLNLYQKYPFAPVLTSQGCPYNCSYCASKFLFNGFIQRNPYDVLNEVEELFTAGVRDFAFYDDALLVNADSHIKVILREIIHSDLKMRFHCPNGLHAKFIDEELAYLMKESGFTTLRLSLETVDAGRQIDTGGKVTTEVFQDSVKKLKQYGFTKGETGVYLMYGLPGQSLEEVKQGVEFLKKFGLRINLTEFSPIPGTQCWEELKDRGIITDDTDPLLTNNSVFSYLFSGYNPAAVERLKLDVKYYNRMENGYGKVHGNN